MVPIICWLAVFFTLGQSKADVIAVDATVPNELAVAGTSNNPAVYIVGNTGPVTRKWSGEKGSMPMMRARLIAVRTIRWWRAHVPVRFPDSIRALSDMKRRRRLTDL